jgi:hypothetical protein
LLVIPFLGNAEVYSSVRSALRRNFSASSIDTILIESAQLQEIIGSTLPALQLQRVILTQANLKIHTPYSTSGPTDEQVFFGREEEKRHIRQHAQSQSFAILGGRQHGKTSLLHRLTLDVLPNDTLGYYTTIVTCQGFRDLDAFYNAQLGWYPNTPPGNPKTIRDLLTLPPQEDGGHIVLLLDEIDVLIRLDRPVGWKVFNDLRAFSDTRAGQLVCCGAYTFDQALRETTGMDSSPFQNFFQKIFYLDPLTQTQVYELVVRTMDEMLGVTFDDSDGVVQRIFEFTNGQPCLIQRICTRLIVILEAKETRRVTVDMVRRLLVDHEFLEEDYLKIVYTALRPLEKLVLLVMMDRKTASEETLRAELMNRAGIQNLPDLHQTLQWLVDLHNILKRTENGAYTFHLKSLPPILKQKISMPFEFDANVNEFKANGSLREQDDL